MRSLKIQIETKRNVSTRRATGRDAPLANAISEARGLQPPGFACRCENAIPIHDIVPWCDSSVFLGKSAPDGSELTIDCRTHVGVLRHSQARKSQFCRSKLPIHDNHVSEYPNAEKNFPPG